MTDVTIYHNPNCGTSRNTLALIEAAGHQPKVVRYVDEGWTAEGLKSLLSRGGLTARDVLRVRGTPAEEVGLTAPDVSEDALIAAMVAHPILVERPIVATEKGVRLCRPAETVQEIL